MYNGIIWKATFIALHTKGLTLEHWETILLNVLHSIRSLLSMATNVSPHERFLCFQHRSATGKAIPTWLAAPGLALLQRSVRQSKFEPLVNEVELIEKPTLTMPTSGSQMDEKIQYQSVIWLLLLVLKRSYKSHRQISRLHQLQMTSKLRCHPWLNPLLFLRQRQSKFQLNSL